MVLIKQDGPAAHLPDDEVELAVVAKITGNHRSAVAVIVRPGEKADVQEIPAPEVAGDIEEDALALVRAEIVAFLDDVPGILDPELAETVIELAGGGDAGATLIRL
jgi:hypothetical protein